VFTVQRGISDALCAELQAMPLEVDTGLRPAGDLPAGGLRSTLEAEGINWLASVPLQTSQGALGALYLGAQDQQTFLPEELEMLASIGRQVGLAVENAQLFEQSTELAVAAERNRLARELHDAVTQTLFSVSLMAEVLPRVWDSDPGAGRAQAEEIRQLAKGALGEMRSLLIELRPQALIDADMKDLFRHLTDAFRGRELIPVELTVQVSENPAPEVKVAFYRIAQEALNNVAKHACASRVSVNLEARPGWVELSVSDDGLGFDSQAVSTGHLGLGIIQERARSIDATVEIRSQTGRGTTVWGLWEDRG
jgi:signal transduction histidine kinase